MKLKILHWFIYGLLVWLSFLSAEGARIKDIANLTGLRENQLMGMGLVVGLKNTGDKSAAAIKALQNLLKRHHFQVTSQQLTSGNIALVMVTANMPPLARKGSKIDVTVSSIGDAKSLAGGVLRDMEKRREEISGVSLDEELVNLRKFQYAYEAAARIFQTG